MTSRLLEHAPDFDGEFGITGLGVFSARYGYLATWELGDLLGELSGRQLTVGGLRGEFRMLLPDYQP